MVVDLGQWRLLSGIIKKIKKYGLYYLMSVTKQFLKHLEETFRLILK